MNELLRNFGSLRRLTAAYWHGQLDAAQERVLEDSTPKETLIGMKPLTNDRPFFDRD